MRVVLQNLIVAGACTSPDKPLSMPHDGCLEGITMLATPAPGGVLPWVLQKALRRLKPWAKAGAYVANIASQGQTGKI